MSTFNSANLALIKRTLLQRVPEFEFTVDDMDMIARQTGLREAQIQQWAARFRLERLPDEREMSLCDYNSPEQPEKLHSWRYYISFFSATEKTIDSLNPKGQPPAYPEFYHAFSLNNSTGFAEGLVEFVDEVDNHELQTFLATQGAAWISIVSFQDDDDKAADALARVWKLAQRPDCKLMIKGELISKMFALAESGSLNTHMLGNKLEASDETIERALGAAVVNHPETMEEKINDIHDFVVQERSRKRKTGDF